MRNSAEVRDRPGRPASAGSDQARPTRGAHALLWLALASAGVAAEQPVAPFDTTRRIVWSSSQVRGAPEPPARYRIVPAHREVTLDAPVELLLAPDGLRWYVLEVAGFVRSFPVTPRASKQGPRKPDVVLDISAPELPFNLRRQAYGMAFHPRFAENGYLYVFYRDARPSPTRSRISRFIVHPRTPGEVPVADPHSETIICEFPAGMDHFGGCLRFGPDGFLYFPVGDGSGYGDDGESGQDLSDFHAAIHRIDVDRTSPGRLYAIPADNPFVDRHGARPEIWAYGLRNVWKMSFDRATGELWAGDVGQDLWESVIKVERGGNYGWSIKEGSHDFRPERPRGPTPILPPLVEHAHFEARSLTGGVVYRGSRLPGLVGAYIYSDYDTGIIWGVRAEAGAVTWRGVLADTPLRVVGFAEDAAGEVLVIDHTGHLYRLDAEDPAVLAAAATHRFPRRLSETGLFASVAEHRMAPGVIPYSVVSPLWSDGAHKQRFIAIPGRGTIDHRTGKGWNFPEGTVLVKTFALDLTVGDPASRRRLETRLLHFEQSTWRGYTYLWNDAQDDAELLDDPVGKDSVYRVTDPAAPGGAREQTWHFPGRAECTLCHTMPANFVLGPNTPQMDRDHDYGNGMVANQLAVFERIGLLAKAAVEEPTEPVYGPALPPIPPLVDPQDASATLDARARSYLQANCAHCHMKMGGGNAYFYLKHGLPLAETGAVNLPPQHSDLGVPGARVLVPGDPDRSLISLRMAMLGQHRMPRIASNVVDVEAVKLIRAWIASLPAE